MDADPSPVVGVGAMLTATREEHGLSIADVAQALKLTQRQVEALETERFDLLPGVAFARGFLRNYARFLGLDPDPLLAALAQTDGVGSPELAPVCNAEGTMPTGDGGLRPSALPIAVLAILLLGVVVAGWYFDWFAQPRDHGESAQVLETPVAPAALTPVPPAADLTPVVIPDDAPAGSAAVAAPPADGVATLPADVPPAAPLAVDTPAAPATGESAAPEPVVSAPMAVAPPLTAEALGLFVDRTRPGPSELPALRPRGAA